MAEETMRRGRNPNTEAKIKPLAKVVVLVVTHLPDMDSEYHKERFDVVEHSLGTCVELADMSYKLDFDFVIWDNGSCEEFRQYLIEAQNPEKMIFSANIGKMNAIKSVMRMLPAGTILSYSDDDMDYAPNWLTPQIKILETYPNVGTVTGYPLRVQGTRGEEATIAWAEKNATVERGRFIPDSWVRDYAASVGAEYSTVQGKLSGEKETRITYNGVQAYAVSHHCQFVCYPERLEHLIPWTDRAMGGGLAFDLAINDAGLLRLATTERLTWHIGNVL